MSAVPTIAAYDDVAAVPVRMNVLAWHDAPAGVAAVPNGGPVLTGNLEVIDRNGRRVRTLPVHFDRRLAFGDTAALAGADHSGSLRVTLQFGQASGSGDLRFSLRPEEGASPVDLLPVLSWWDSLREGRGVGLRAEDGRWLVGPSTITDPAPSISEEYSRAVRALARIQEKTGPGFAMPTQMSLEQAQNAAIADRLLQGATVTGRWSGLSIGEDDLDPGLGEQLRLAPHGVRLEMEAEHRLELSSATLVIGTVEYRYRQAVVSDSTAPGLQLVPGKDDHFEIRMVRVVERTRADGATSWIPDAMTEPYAGRWVAQSGTTIVTSGGSFETVAHAVRASGVLATIWRVPGAEEEQPVTGALM